MKETILVKRYLNALEESLKPAEKETVFQQFSDFVCIIVDNKKLWEIIKNPTISKKDQKHLLDTIIEKVCQNISKNLKNLIQILINKGRINLLPEFQKHLNDYINKITNQVSAQFITASDLELPKKQILVNNIAKLTNKKIRAKFKVDPTILGGFKVYQQNKEYDASIKGNLKKFEESLAL